MTIPVLTNPRTYAEFEDWPSGRKRVKCVFQHEANRKGERISRTTTGKPKFTVYYQKIRIVDGDDNRTHLLALTEYGSIYVLSSDMKHSEYTVYPTDAEYQTLLEMFSN